MTARLRRKFAAALLTILVLAAAAGPMADVLGPGTVSARSCSLSKLNVWINEYCKCQGTPVGDISPQSHVSFSVLDKLTTVEVHRL